MHEYVGYTIPLSDDQVFTLIEFGELKWIPPIASISRWEFILHSYQTGEIQYEALVGKSIFIYTESQLKFTKACQCGSFKDQGDTVVYHLSDHEVYELQTKGSVKLCNTDDVRIGQFERINLGGNFRYVCWVNDIMAYFYESDKTDVDCPY